MMVELLKRNIKIRLCLSVVCLSVILLYIFLSVCLSVCQSLCPPVSLSFILFALCLYVIKSVLISWQLSESPTDASVNFKILIKAIFAQQIQ